MFNWFAEVATVCGLNLRNLRHRLDSSLVAVIGFAGVVTVFVAVLSISTGFNATLQATGSPDVAIVMRGGAGAELNSVLTSNNARLIGEAPGVITTADGPLVSPQLLVIINRPKKSTGLETNVSFRGVDAGAFKVNPRIQIVRGRNFRPGLNEIIVGTRAASEFRGLQLGGRLKSGRTTWKIVGVFNDGGGLYSSEIWGDLPAVQAAYHRGPSLSSVHVKLASPAAFDKFKQSLESDPQLNVSVERESDYFAEQARAISGFITGVGSVIALLMGIGAVFGAINTMYTAVSARSTEIASLRALGFGRSPVLISVLVEGVLLGLVGGVIGSAVAYGFFNGFEASTFNNFSQIVFAFAVTPTLLAVGVGYALLMGLIGGLLPAFRAMRIPIAAALRGL